MRPTSFFTLILVFFLSAATRADDLYSIPQAAGIKVSDQRDAGLCWAHAFSSYLSMSQRLNPQLQGVGFRASHQFMDLLNIRKKAKAFLQNTEELQHTSLQGNSIQDTHTIFLQAGLVPSESWKPAQDTDRDSVRGKLMKKLKNLVKETRKLLENKSLDRATILRDAENRVDAVLLEFFGPFPETFVFRGSTYSPAAFRDYAFDTAKFSSRLNYNLAYPPYKHYAEQGLPDASKKFYLYPDDLARQIKAEIDGGNPVITSVCLMRQSWDKGDRVTLPMVSGSFEKCPGYGHGVVITGYYFDRKKNRVSGYRVLNSWGEEKGDRGFFIVPRIYSDLMMSSLFLWTEKTGNPPEDAPLGDNSFAGVGVQ